MGALIELVCCYARKDEADLSGLFAQLRALERAGLLKVWRDRQILPGEPFDDAINAHLDSAHIILLITSSNFIDSDYCYEKEMSRALTRQERGEARVLPVILHPCAWEDTLLGELQALPTDGKPISDRVHWPNEHNAWLDVTRGVKRIARELQVLVLAKEGQTQYQAGHYSEALAAYEEALSLIEDQQDSYFPSALLKQIYQGRKDALALQEQEVKKFSRQKDQQNRSQEVYQSDTEAKQSDLYPLLHRRYRILRVIGRSGVFAIYEVRDVGDDRIRAIKELIFSGGSANELVRVAQNFQAEARILMGLEHPNLPAFSGFFVEDMRYFLVMEFIDGNTLEELLEANHGPFSERRVLGWARQLCDVLEYLHGQKPPVIFRDLKPGNIMLTRNGRIKLIDFGIARLFRRSSSQDTQLLGTPGFAPPEQYGSTQTDERSDIYSLAMTLAQLMTDDINENGFGLKDVHFTYPHISPPVARVLEKATSLKPDDRYESVTVFRSALLGIGTFRFKNGDEATTPDELAELCSYYQGEAADYLFAGEVESWLQEIGKDEMARAVKRLRRTVGDSETAVEMLIQLLFSISKE